MRGDGHTTIRGRCTVGPMSSSTRWLFGADVAWQMPVTFSRRRDDFLEWVEKEVPVSNFFEDGTAAGVAVERDSRLTINRRSMHVRLSGPDGNLGQVRQLTSRALELLEPDRISPYLAVGVFSYALDAEYDDARRRLAAVSLDQISPEVDPYDVAILWDGLLDGAHVQCEFGIVSADELVFRLGNLENTRHTAVVQDVDLSRAISKADLPDVSVFVTVVWEPLSSQASAGELLTLLKAAEQQVTQVADAIRDRVVILTAEG